MPGMYLWTTPRSGSTCLFRAFLQIETIIAWLEPFLLEKNISGDPLGQEKKHVFFDKQIEIQEQMDSCSFFLVKEHAWVAQHFLKLREEMQHLFSFIDIRHVILIRNPEKILSSWKRLIERGRDSNGIWFEDFARKNEMDLCSLEFVYHALGGKCLIIDMDELIENPFQEMTKICSYVDFPFSPRLLKWDKLTEETMSHNSNFQSFLLAQEWFSSIINSTTFCQTESFNSKQILEFRSDWKILLETNMDSFWRLKDLQVSFFLWESKKILFVTRFIRLGQKGHHTTRQKII